MRIGVTITIQSSTFSGGVNTTSLHLATLLKELGHDVYLVNNTQQSWFDDNRELAKEFKVIQIGEILEGRCDVFDTMIESSWLMGGDLRIHLSRSSVVVVRKSPIFTDLEASVYAIRLGNNRADRVDSIWCIGNYSPDDEAYMRLLYSDRQVYFLPFIWYPNIVDSYCQEIKNLILPESPTWEVHICESNQSIGSSALIPLTICRDLVAECAKQRSSERFTWLCHSAEHLKSIKYFMTNIFASLFPEDASKNLVPRVPLPILRNQKACILSHERFSGMRAMYIDALWLGIPLVHNLPELGFGYVYKENNVGEAVSKILEIVADYKGHKGFFSPGAEGERRTAIRNMWIPSKKTLEEYQQAITSCKFRIPVRMENLLTVYPEQLGHRTHLCGIADDSIPTNSMWDQTELRLCRFAVANSLAGVFVAKTAGCVPIYVGLPLEEKYNPKAYVHVDTIEKAVDFLKTTHTRQWVSLFMQPIMIPQESKLPRMITQAHLINLARRPDRLERFNKTHPDLSGNIQRFDAVDGRATILTDEMRHLFRNNRFGWKKGVVGCTLSHYRIWQKLAADPSPDAAYLVLEDDAVLDSSWRSRWNELIETNGCIPADVMYLGGVLPPNRPGLPTAINTHDGKWASFKASRMFVQPSAHPSVLSQYFHMCAYAYVMTRHGARKLMELVEKEGLERVSDHMMCDNYELLGLGLLYPTVASCYQDEDPRYGAAEFNNYTRSEKTDTDLWNNDDRFTPEEIFGETNEITLPTDLRDGMPVDEAFGVLTKHYTNPWILCRVCFALNMNHHGFFTLHNALGSPDSLSVGNPMHIKIVLGQAGSKITEFAASLDSHFIRGLMDRLDGLVCLDSTINNELVVLKNTCKFALGAGLKK